MKIIKNSKKEPTPITCHECGSELEYTFDDIKRRDVQSFFTSRIDRYLICPVCKSDIIISPVVGNVMREEKDDENNKNIM